MRNCKVAGLAFIAAASVGDAVSVATSEGLNPIRKVVNLLQGMQKTIQKQGEKDEELYEKFQCYCKHGTGDLSASIAAAEDKAPSVASDIEAKEGKLSATKSGLESATEDRGTAKTALAEAKGVREKEAAEFATSKADLDTNIAALKKATTAIDKGSAGAFLQTDAAQVLRQLASRDDFAEADKQDILAFLDQSSEYAPQSGQIGGILKQLSDDMSGTAAELTAAEDKALQGYRGLTGAKLKEIAALTAQVEESTEKIGRLGVEIVQHKEDLSDTQAALLEDKKLAAELEKSCGTKEAEWDERQKTRSEEVLAIAETIKILNDDEALDLFKKTLPSPEVQPVSFVQVDRASPSLRRDALAAVKQAAARSQTSSPGLELLAIALSGKKALSRGAFDKVLKMVDDMVSLLGKEQDDDNNKKEYCAKSFDEADDQLKDVTRLISGLEADMDKDENDIKSVGEEIAALQAGLQELEKQSKEASQQRKDENAEFQESLSGNTAALQLLDVAKNRLNEFYNPKLYKAPKKQELSAEDRVYSSMGGELATTTPGGIAGTGVVALAEVGVHRQLSSDTEGGAPATWEGDYKKSGSASNGVISMLDLLRKDLQKEITESKAEEKAGQANYEKFEQDAGQKRKADSKSLARKQATKADLQEQFQANKGKHVDAVKDEGATQKYIASLHTECDWLVKYFDVRKDARAGELDSLNNAKAVLSGADYSFVQTNSRRGFLARVN